MASVVGRQVFSRSFKIFGDSSSVEPIERGGPKRIERVLQGQQSLEQRIESDLNIATARSNAIGV